MAMNPMQRKIRNSFLFGFLIAVIVAAVIIGLLFMKIKGLNVKMQEEIQKAKIATTTCYATTEDVRAGSPVTLTEVEVITANMPPDAVTDLSIFSDEEGELEMVAVTDLDKGTILTKSLVTKDASAGSYRTVEFSNILLPTKLAAGEFIDIRVQFVDAVESIDFVVLSKLKVKDCTAGTIWLDLTDAELQVLECAMVESYAIQGSKLYATQFMDDAQPEIAATYVPSKTVADLIRNNSIIKTDEEIANRYNEEDDYTRIVRESVDEMMARQESADTIMTQVRAGITTEKTSIQAARSELLGEE